MAFKRSAAIAFPSAQQSVDDGDGPYPLAYLPPAPGIIPIDLDAICNSDQLITQDTLQQLGLVEAPPTPKHEFPLEVDYRDYALTKNSSKQIRIGMDLKDFTPYIMLMGDANSKGNRSCIKITVDEFYVFTSDEVFQHIKSGLDTKTCLDPLPIGGLTLNIKVQERQPRITTVCIERENIPVKIYLGASSWSMINKAKKLMKNRLDYMHTICKTSQLRFPDLLQNCRDFCLQRGFKQLNFEKQSATFSTAFEQPTLFPQHILNEMVCYHFEFLKEKLFATL